MAREMRWPFAIVLIAGLAGATYFAGLRQGRRAAGPGEAVSTTEAERTAPAAEARQAYGRLAEFFEARLEEQRAAAPSWTEVLASNDPGHLVEWQTRARAHLLDILQPWPGPRIEPAPERTPWFDRDGVTAFQVRIPTHEGIETPAALLIPNDVEPPFPAILTLHGSEGTLRSLVEDVDYHHGFAMALARNGFLVLAPYRPTGVPAARQVIRASANAAGQSLEALELWQVARAIDYLTTLDIVDQNLIGVYGISSGGTLAMRIGALDTRLGLTLVSGKFTDRDSLFSSNWLDLDSVQGGTPGMINGMFRGMAFLMDDVNLAALVVPRFFGVENGQNDWLYEPARSEFTRVTGLYRHVGHEDRAQFLSFPGGHETSVSTVLPFLREWASQGPAN